MQTGNMMTAVRMVRPNGFVLTCTPSSAMSETQPSGIGVPKLNNSFTSNPVATRIKSVFVYPNIHRF